MKKYLAIAVLMIVTATSLTAQCKVGKTAAPTGFWTWAPESRVKVYVSTSDFDAAEVPYLVAPLAKWNAVSETTGSRVKLEYHGTTATPLYCQNCLTITRGHVFDKAKRHLTELRTYSAARNEIMTWAGIVVDPRLTNPKTLTNAVAHELGHSFGLLDCYTCRKNSTVMNQFDAVNTASELQGPSSCDVVQVKTQYQAVAAKPIHLKPIVVEEGEEPVEDDTPIVVPKP